MGAAAPRTASGCRAAFARPREANVAECRIARRFSTRQMRKDSDEMATESVRKRGVGGSMGTTARRELALAPRRLSHQFRARLLPS
jgi:hypothetical protein